MYHPVKPEPGPGARSAARSGRSLIIGALLLALMVIGAELVWFLHSMHGRPNHAARAADSVTWPAAPDTRAPPPERSERQPERRTTSGPPVTARHDQEAPAPAVNPPTSAVGALRRRDLLLAAHNQQAIQEADERVFVQLNVPEHQRVAIRLLNERLARRRQDLVAAETEDLTPEAQAGASIAIGDEIARDRQSAAKELLGPETYQAFQIAESAEIRRVQRRYRVQWAQELDEQAPLPPGLPPRAH